MVSKLSEIWVGDPGSEIRDPEKTSPESRGKKAPDHVSRIRLRNTEGGSRNLLIKEKNPWLGRAIQNLQGQFSCKSKNHV